MAPVKRRIPTLAGSRVIGAVCCPPVEERAIQQMANADWLKVAVERLAAKFVVEKSTSKTMN